MDYRTKAIFQAVSGGIAIASVMILVMVIANPQPTPEQKFKVVDSYGNCKVIRYTDPSNYWHYFLRCST